MQGYKHDDAFDEGYLQVSDLHKVYYTQYGKQDGKTGELHSDRGISKCLDMSPMFGLRAAPQISTPEHRLDELQFFFFTAGPVVALPRPILNSLTQPSTGLS